MKRRPPGATRANTLCPYTTRGRSLRFADGMAQRRGEQCPPGRLADTRDGIVADHAHRRPFERQGSGERLVDKRQRTDGLDIGTRRRSALDHGRLARKRSEEHPSELQSLMRISYAVCCSKKKNRHTPYLHMYHIRTQLR